MSRLVSPRPPKRRIIFTFDRDFSEAFEYAGIDPQSVTDDEWRVFEKTFMESIHWDEIAELVASNIAAQREIHDK